MENREHQGRLMNLTERIDTFFRTYAERRRKERLIPAALPEMIDLLALVMQAGLDFQVALAHYLDKAPAGPLRDEMAVVQSEIRTGHSRVDALGHLCQRVPDRDVRETARAIIQGIELGSSLTPILRTQAKALRRRRAFEAEKRAAVAPLKLMFPLFVFIFPTLFVVLFGPVVLTVLSGHGL
jgi:tight adherence protein C